MIGETVSHYRIEEKLGEGGMGVVYRAQDIRLGRSVALKALTPEFARDPARRKRFQQEARAAASLTHPGIAAVYALEEVGEDLYIVYEYVRGQNLRGLVTRGDLKLEGLLDIATDVAAALAAAHAQGVVHRDIKPENIIRTPEGNTKILDFGLARFQPGSLDSATHSAGLTDTGSIVGTVAYMSPEQLEGREADFRTDIFSFGVLLYELATGVRPFEGTSPASTIARILTTEPVPMIQRNPVTPPELDRIVRKCLRKRPEERYQSTRDLLVDLETLRRDTSAVRPPAVAAPPEEVEASLLGRAFSVYGATPRRWWELNHLFCILGASIPVVIAWKVKEWVPGTWGLGLFFTVLVFVAALVTLRLYLLVTAAFIPSALPNEVRRVEPWQWRVDLAFMVVLLVMAGQIATSHTAAAALLLVLAIAGIVVRLLVEPAIARAAFPSGVTEEKVVPERKRRGVPRGFRLIAAIQLLYLLPLVYLLARSSWLVEDVAQWQQRGLPPSEALQVAGFLGAFLAALLIGGATTLALWRGDSAALRAFCRWFPLYVLIDIPGAAYVVVVTLKYVNTAAAVLFVLPVVVYLPLYQRRLARKALATFPSEPASPASTKAGAVTVWRGSLLRKGLLGAAALAAATLVLVVGLNVGGWRERLLGTGAPRIESIAVLPLENLSRDPEQEYFADGMTEALISDLAQISALRVISRTSVMQYKGARKPLPEIARELNVDAVV
ncbi:MAG: protein kinase, partial [Acidobacteria bacterium]|nr:protein kinase [Acidobacteriota bacterium]